MLNLDISKDCLELRSSGFWSRTVSGMRTLNRETPNFYQSHVVIQTNKSKSKDSNAKECYTNSGVKVCFTFFTEQSSATEHLTKIAVHSINSMNRSFINSAAVIRWLTIPPSSQHILSSCACVPIVALSHLLIVAHHPKLTLA
jgi:hypothetical protein